MGLKTDISNAFQNLMTNGGKVELLPEQIENIDVFAYDLTESIKIFLTKQTWQITDLKAFVELDEFEITKPQVGDVQPGVTTTVTGGSVSGGPVSGTGTVPPGGGTKGVNIPEIKASKIDKGGKLTATGHAFVGSSDNYPDLFEEYDTDGDNYGWNRFSKVKIKSLKADK